MQEMCPTDPGDVAALLAGLTEAGRPFAIATVLEAERSTPVRAGAKAVIEPGNTIHGTVGGGAVEAEARRWAMGVIASGEPVVFDFDLAGSGAEGTGSICGGRMRLLVAPGSTAGPEEYRRAAAALARRERGVWQTELRRGHGLKVKVECRFIAATEIPTGSSPATAATLESSLAEERPIRRLMAEATGAAPFEVFLEPLLPKPVLVIVGGGHVGRAVAAQAQPLGFAITVIEDRPEYADAGLFPPAVTTICGSIAEEVSNFPVDKDTYVVVATRDHQQDSAALRACVRRPAAYLGMIGSRRKVPLLRRQFLDNQWASAEEFDRVHAPIGLDIGAVTVAEIAVSIVAQMIAVRRTGTAPRIPLL